MYKLHKATSCRNDPSPTTGYPSVARLVGILIEDIINGVKLLMHNIEVWIHFMSFHYALVTTLIPFFEF